MQLPIGWSAMAPCFHIPWQLLPLFHLLISYNILQKTEIGRDVAQSSTSSQLLINWFQNEIRSLTIITESNWWLSRTEQAYSDICNYTSYKIIPGNWRQGLTFYSNIQGLFICLCLFPQQFWNEYCWSHFIDCIKMSDLPRITKMTNGRGQGGSSRLMKWWIS